jgi:hypothetical protein
MCLWLKKTCKGKINYKEVEIVGVLVVGISRFPLGSPGTKSHLAVAPMERCIIYYKGEGGGFPQVRVVVSLVSLSCLWLVITPKVLQLCTNHLVLVLCKFVWVVEACHFFLVPSWSSSTPLYLPKCCELGSVLQLFILSLFLVWIHIWVLQGIGSMSVCNHPHSILLVI